jgi:hypothetical protein
LKPQPAFSSSKTMGDAFMADTIMLTDHEAIRSWAAARAGFPAIVDVSPETGTQALLRLVFAVEQPGRREQFHEFVRRPA